MLFALTYIIKHKKVRFNLKYKYIILFVEFNINRWTIKALRYFQMKLDRKLTTFILIGIIYWAFQ